MMRFKVFPKRMFESEEELSYMADVFPKRMVESEE